MAAKKELWQSVSIALEEFGSDTLILRSIPQIMSFESAITLVQELLAKNRKIETY